MFFEIQPGFFFLGNFFLCRVVTAIPSRLDLQTGLCRCPANESQKDVHRTERLSRPVSRDRSEQPMFHGIPLRRTARIMTHRDRQPCLRREFPQQFFPHPNPTTVAPARVRKDQQSFRVWIFFLTDDLPPTTNRINRKSRRVSRCADFHKTFVPRHIINSIRNRLERRLVREVVRGHFFAPIRRFPPASGVGEIADKFDTES